MEYPTVYTCTMYMYGTEISANTTNKPV